MATPKSKITSALIETSPNNGANPERERVFNAFRQWGYLEGDLDPLGFLRPRVAPELQIEGEYAREARAIYSSTIGVEINHIYNPERRRWIYEQMESPSQGFEVTEKDQQRILDLLIRADIFEQVMQQRYLGSKRFSLEGVTALIPLVDELLDTGSRLGATELVMGMSHRGRLNVIAHVAKRPPEEIFAGFEDVDPRSVLGSGDVKYHMGATGEYITRSGNKVHIHLVSNPSHLEAVDPVTVGRTRAKQDRTGEGGREKYLPLLVHGDAAFAGQGILAETMNYADLPGYTVGGTIHVIVNNLLGFTTSYLEEHSTRFAACIARRQSIPIFHVNGEDVDAVVRVARLATEYRYHFGTDVVIDLIGYRRHGHSEVDDPTITQPLLYKKIKEHPPLWEIYADDIGATDAPAQAAAIKAEFESAQKDAGKLTKKPSDARPAELLGPILRRPAQAGIRSRNRTLDRRIGRANQSPHHVSRGLPHSSQSEEASRTARRDGRRQTPRGLRHGRSARLRQPRESRHPGSSQSGQDSRRGTFNQRHSVLIDIENENEYVPLENIAPGQARCGIHNSTLSEPGVLGFEYGYSRDYPEALVLWEAQFGDFVNVAQAIIDQFISAGEAKWNLLSGLVLLLPHGYEGQGPEHSSARIERFLQLAAKHNIQITQPSNAAQYFHLLRRQALRHWRKPLVVFTPKSMLRHPDASSPIADFTHKNFQNVIPDTEIGEADRILVCTGKIGHELQAERKKRKDNSTAIVFLEQLYPFPEKELAAEFARHGEAGDIVWVQEEPANMGALFNMLPRLQRIAGNRHVLSVKRSSSASPATGSAKAHEVEQKTLLTLAFTTKG